MTVRPHRGVPWLGLRNDDDRLRRLSRLRARGDDAEGSAELAVDHDRRVVGVTDRRRKWDDLRAVVYPVLQ